MNQKNTPKTILLYIACVVGAMALTFDRQVNVKDLFDLREAHGSCLGIAPAIVVILLIIAVNHNYEDYRIRGNLHFLIPCIILSQCYWVGFRLDNEYEIINATKCSILQWSIITIGYTFALYTVITVVSAWLSDIDISDTEKPDKKSTLKWGAISFVASAVVFLVFYCLLYPGVVTNDTYWQINQALGFEPLSNHHPFAHTILESFFLKPAYFALHNTETGIGLFILFQLLVMSLIIAYSQTVLCELRVSRRVRVIVLLFYLINPIFGVYSVTMWKDVWMGMMLLLFLLQLIKTIVLNDIRLASLLLLWFSALGVLLSKATGIAMIMFALFAVIIISLKRKPAAIKSAIAITTALVCFVVIQYAAVNVMGVIPSESGESKSVPLQQIARTVKYHGDELSEEEKTSIREILPYEELADRYNPRLSDPVKNFFDETNYNKDKVKYLKLWIKLGTEYPSEYIKSFLFNTYGYWYPDAEYWVVTAQSYRSFIADDNKPLYDKYAGSYDMSDKYFEKRNNVVFAVNIIRRIPLVSLLFSIAAYYWIYLIMMFAAFKDKKIWMAIPLSIAAAVFISCLISPLYCEMRYAYPGIIIFPFAIILSLLPSDSSIELKKE